MLSEHESPIPRASSREAIEERERNAGRPRLLRVATLGVVLSGALFFVSVVVGFVMFMNARESIRRESIGVYHSATFRVVQSYWQPGNDIDTRPTSVAQRAFARGIVEGRQEWLDLGPYFVLVPKDEESVHRAVPPGTLIPVSYNPSATGYHRVLLQRATSPVDANRRVASASLSYGLLSASVTGFALLGFLRLRRLCF